MSIQTVKKPAALAVVIALLVTLLSVGIACDIFSEESPEAAFSAEPTSGIAPLTVQFTDQSTSEVTAWEWDFDSNGTLDSTEQNPSYKYNEAGEYTVSLTVTGPGGSDTEVKAQHIQVTPAPIAGFTAIPTYGGFPLDVLFTDRSTGDITSWEWDFDNNGTVDSTEQNPSYTYNEAGEYTVSLKVTVPGGSDTEVKAQHIHASIFPDSNLEAAIREAIGKPEGTVLLSDLAALTSLTATYADISNLTGLENCINLTVLNLWSNDIFDLSPLANLTKLTNLNLGNNDNSIDLSPLANLTNLTELSFASNSMTVGANRDLSPLANLTGLTKLDLSDCFIRDISALANLTNLTDLNLGRNMTTGNDLIPLVNLVNLKVLSLYNTPYSGTLDIGPLIDNPGLSEGDLLWLGPTLSSNTINIYIPQLQARGVDVRY